MPSKGLLINFYTYRQHLFALSDALSRLIESPLLVFDEVVELFLFKGLLDDALPIPPS